MLVTHSFMFPTSTTLEFLCSTFIHAFSSPASGTMCSILLREVLKVTWLHKMVIQVAEFLMWLKLHSHKELVRPFQMPACICRMWD